MASWTAGQKLGQYEIVAHLQSGGMGEIYEVLNLPLQRHEAMKILPDELAAQPDFVLRFIGEARKNAALDHPHIVPVYHISAAETRPVYFTMKLIRGQNLKQWFRGRLPLSEAEAAGLVCQICDALQFAHDRQTIHRDLKPANLMFDQDGGLYLMDFGIAFAAQDTHLTQTGMQMGTAAYMSPEQALDAKHVDARTDLYSLGVMLFEMLTGQTPYQSDSQVSLALKHLNAPIPDPRELRPALSAEIAGIVNRLLQKSADARFASAQELKQQLVAWPRAKALPAGGEAPFDPGELDAFTAVSGDATAAVSQARTASAEATLQVPTQAGVPPAAEAAGLLPEPSEPPVAERPRRNRRWLLGLLLMCWFGSLLYARRQRTPVPAPEIRPSVLTKGESHSQPEVPDEPEQPEQAEQPSGRFPFTEDREVRPADMQGKNCFDLEIMRNEIYARYGRRFQNPQLQAYFEAQDWYEVEPDYHETDLDPLEKANAGLIRATEQARGCL